MNKLILCRIEKLKGFFENFAQIRKSQGFCPAIVSLARGTKQRLFFRGDCFLCARSLEEPILATKPLNDLVLKEAQTNDLHLFEEMKKPSEMLWYKVLLESERSCVMAFKSNRLAAYGWFTSKVDPLVERTYVPLAQDEMFIFDLFTMPAFRRQGFQNALLQYILELAKQREYKCVFSLVMVDNMPSLELHNKLGFRVITRFTRVRFLGWVRFYFRPNIFGKAGDIVMWL